MQIHAGWEFGTWHLSLTNLQIIISFSTWEYKNKSRGGKSIFLVTNCRDSRKSRIMTFEMSENQEMSESRGFDDEIDILLYQNGAEKINQDVKINI